MYRRCGLAIAATLLLALGLAATAFAGTVTITFTSASSYDNTYDGFYAGIYNGYVNNTPAQFVCDDFLTEIGDGQMWSAYSNINNPVSSGPTGVKYTGSTGGFPISNPQLVGLGLTQQQEYNMVTWLVQQIFNDPTNSKGDWGALGGAIWAITDGGWNNSDYTGTVYGSGAYSMTAYDAVQNSLAYMNASSALYHVYTPTVYADGQEFFSPTSAAEPSVALLLILSVALVGGWALKRRSSSSSPVR